MEDKDKEGGGEDESCWLWTDEEERGDDIEKLVRLWMLVEML